MAITVNSVVRSTGQASAPRRMQTLNVDMDASYPTGGEDVSASLVGGTVEWSETVPHYDGATLRFFRVSSAGKIQAFVSTGGAPGVEVTAATDLSGHTGVQLAVFTQ